jgi:hypothetical protein
MTRMKLNSKYYLLQRYLHPILNEDTHPGNTELQIATDLTFNIERREWCNTVTS